MSEQDHLVMMSKRHCKFPWWALFALLGAIVLGLIIWYWIRSKNYKKPTEIGVAMVDANWYPNANTNVANNGVVTVNNANSMPSPASGTINSPANAYTNNSSNSQVNPLWYNNNSAINNTSTCGSLNQQQQQQGSQNNDSSFYNGTGNDVISMAQQKRDCLVMYSMKGCGPCTQTYPQMKEASSKLNIPTIVADESTLLPNEKPSKGFPHIFLQKANGSRITYNGHRNANSLVNFVSSNVPNAVKNNMYF